MRNRLTLATAIAAALASGTLPATAQVAPQPGFGSPTPLPLSSSRALGSTQDGRFVSFDGLEFELYSADGTLILNLGSLTSFAFPSCVEVEPGETYALVGESSTGNIYRVELGGAGYQLLANLNFNYDLAFDASAGLAYASAALGGFGAGNDIVRLDLSTGSTTLLAHVQGPSGPITVNSAGDLFYVTQYAGSNWPPPTGQQTLLRWDDAQLDSGTLLDEGDATTLRRGLDGGSSLVYEPPSEHLFLAHTNFAGLENEILQFDAGGQLLRVVATSPTHVQDLDLLNGGPQTFSAYQPAGAHLRLYNTDFFSFDHLVTLETARTVMAWSGPDPGTTGRGTFSLSAGVPGGFVSLMIADSADELPQEDHADVGWDAPMFSAVDIDDFLRRSQPMALDANGEVKRDHYQTPAIEGAFLLQAIVFDAQMVPVGTSTHAINH